MTHHGGYDDRRRSPPYYSSSDRSSRHHHQHKIHNSDDKEFRSKERNGDFEKHQHRKQDERAITRKRERKCSEEDYGNRGDRESSRYHKHGKNRESHHRRRSPSRSDDKPISKRTSGFDVAPPVTTVMTNPSESNVWL